MSYKRNLNNYIACPICTNLVYIGSERVRKQRLFYTCSHKCQKLYEAKYHPRKGISHGGRHFKQGICIVCGIDFEFRGKGIKRDSKRKFCSRICYNQFLKIPSQHPSWKGGKPKCIDCGQIVSEYYVKRCDKCERKFRTKENHPSWRGGITPIHQAIRNSVVYQQWRTTIFERDNYTCQMCGKRGGDLNVDHYPVTFSQILRQYKVKSLDEAINTPAFWDTTTNRTLCVDCHRTTF